MTVKIHYIVDIALKEDHARQDITTKLLIPDTMSGKAVLTANAPGVVCGLETVEPVLKNLDRTCHIKKLLKDGSRITPGRKLALIHGPLHTLLAAERTILNFLSHLSGISTLTRKFVDAVAGTGAKIYDTRKTLPGLRTLDKYAVKCGGGYNHREDLASMVLVKDNHLNVMGQDTNIRINKLKKIRAFCDRRRILFEIEAKDLGEVWDAIVAGADIIMLDNMKIPELKEALRLIRAAKDGMKRKTPVVEVSGGITLANVRQSAKLGVDRISIGAITHSAPALDISMEIEHT